VDPAPGDAPLRIDGRLDEAVWQRAPAFDGFTQYLPVDRQAPPAGYRTTVQIVAEHDAIVLGIRAWDPAPEDIRAPPQCRLDPLARRSAPAGRRGPARRDVRQGRLRPVTLEIPGPSA